MLQEDGKLRCPAGASLWLSEVRQENAFTQRAVYLAYQTDCQLCTLRDQCLASGAKGDRARRVSAVRRLLPPPAPVQVSRQHTATHLADGRGKLALVGFSLGGAYALNLSVTLTEKIAAVVTFYASSIEGEKWNTKMDMSTSNQTHATSISMTRRR